MTEENLMGQISDVNSRNQEFPGTVVAFDGPSKLSQMIKVIGVGGGGCNAVNNMADKGIVGADFIVANTDKQAISSSPVTNKILLGPERCKGLGAGAKPELAQQAAEESGDEARAVLGGGATSMVFITAGMGGGTGTGAAPVIAKIAKEMGILTVGVVTIPFVFEGRKKIHQALAGVERMKENVDAMLVINNERLRDINPQMEISEAFSAADNVLLNAVKGISEMITVEGHINVDFQDVKTTLTAGGVAVMNTGEGEGENRLQDAIENAINSPLLKDKDIRGAKHILFVIYTSNDDKQVKMDEITHLNNFMADEVCNDDVDVIWGLTYDNKLESGKVKITLIASGFNTDEAVVKPQKTEDTEKTQTDLFGNSEKTDRHDSGTSSEHHEEAQSSNHEDTKDEDNFDSYYGDTNIEREKKEQKLNEMMQKTNDENVVKHMEEEPAYKRRQNLNVHAYVPKNRRSE